MIEMLDNPAAQWIDTSNFHNLTREGYLKNIIAARCIQMISRGVGSLNWKVYDKQGEEVTDGELVKLLLRPNPIQGSTSFFQELELFKLISGNTFLRAIRNNEFQAPSELYVLRPDTVKVEPGAFELPKYYEHSHRGNLTRFPVDQVSGNSDVLHMYFPNPVDEWYGLSPLAQAAQEIAIHNEGAEHNKKLLQNGARPSGMLHTDQELSDDSRSYLKRELEEKFQGSANAGRPLVTEGGVKWTEMGISPKDMDFLNARNSSARDIAQAFGVPPQLVGLTESSTFNNVREAKLELWESTIMPEGDLIKTELNHWLAPMFGEFTIDYCKDSITALQPRRDEKWKTAESASFLTVNEKRSMVGLGPVDNGDQLLTQQRAEPEQPKDPQSKSYDDEDVVVTFRQSEERK